MQENHLIMLVDRPVSAGGIVGKLAATPAQNDPPVRFRKELTKQKHNFNTHNHEQKTIHTTATHDRIKI